ncbi:type II secretion system F family protein [Buchananella hordeovulneris]|uniref:type II secretion system F family protein n=1 Tax=Buchananella hordeovulneris TaxID=52770 RepID=UPI000F5EBA6D|nr:type II secretion system F family protein [Buchananella hordeovulneris]RRD50154.1 type II secretion system F family protein [Buchananella hordeovulneris]
MNWLEWSWAGASVGAIFAAGVALLWWLARARVPRLEDRVRPYVAVCPPLAAETRWRRSWQTLAGPVAVRGARVLEMLGSTRVSVARRLGILASPVSVEQFRLAQVAWSGGGLALGAFCAVLLAARRPVALVPVLIGVLLLGLAGALVRDKLLTRAAVRRQAELLTELPDLAELLALAVGAGESLPGALERVGRIGTGPLAGELCGVVARVRAGEPLIRTLNRLADRVDVAALTRCVSAMTTAVERGTPLAAVLRAQALDARQAARQALLESGGKREIAMMLPVVFLLLPITVLFALYPGLQAIESGW